jgi:hypothetical protein
MVWPQAEEHLHSVCWRRVVLDECHENTVLGNLGCLTELAADNVWLVTGTPFPHGDQSMYGMHQLLGIKLKVHVSASPFVRNNSTALGATHPFERLKHRIYLRNTRASVGSLTVASDSSSSSSSKEISESSSSSSSSSTSSTSSSSSSSSSNSSSSSSSSSDSPNDGVPAYLRTITPDITHTRHDAYDEYEMQLVLSNLERGFYDAHHRRGEYAPTCYMRNLNDTYTHID